MGTTAPIILPPPNFWEIKQCQYFYGDSVETLQNLKICFKTSGASLPEPHLFIKISIILYFEINRIEFSITLDLALTDWLVPEIVGNGRKK